MLTVDDIREMLRSGKLMPDMNDVVASGIFLSSTGTKTEYTLHYGWDIAKCHACDESWHPFNLQLMQWIADQKYDAERLQKVLETVQIDDDHWKWFIKAMLLKTGEYHWFFLMAEDKPQAACVIYHPKKSELAERDVFYIEYIAVAPWNRQNPMAERTFKGVGSLLIKSIIEYSVRQLSFHHGFSLHALPRAVDFYAKIGMQKIPACDKDELQYFEMPEEIATKYVGAT
ncbi:MAG: hypothetical protein Q8R69_23690 [Telluria sp.]|nr:hypothetical protein [Telluria sp.]